MRCTSPLYAFHQHCFCVTMNLSVCWLQNSGNLLAASKSRKIIWLAISWCMRCKAFETLLGTVCMPVCACVHSHLNLFFFFFSVSCLPQSFDVRMSSLHSQYWIPCVMIGVWCYSWVLWKCFAPASVVVCKHLFCDVLWLIIFFTFLCCLIVPLIWTMYLK